MNINNLPQIIRLNTKLKTAESALDQIRELSYIVFSKISGSLAIIDKVNNQKEFEVCIEALKKKYEAEIEAIKKEIEGIN